MSETRVALAVFLLISGINFFGIAYLIREVNALVVEQRRLLDRLLFPDR